MRVEQKALADLGWGQLLDALAARTHTVRGQEAAIALPLFRDLGAARERSEEIAEARRLHSEGELLPWGGVADVRGALTRAEKGGVLEGEDLRQIAETLRAGAALRRFLLARFETATRLAARAEPIAELPDVSGPIGDSFDPSGRLADHASPSLGPLRRRVAELNAELGRTVRGLLDDPEIAPLLQDRFYTQRDERYVLPIKSAARARVRGILHGSSQSGATVFVEPVEVVELNNGLKLAELEVAEEERRILTELTAYVREELPRIGVNLGMLETLDLIDAAARLADDLECAPPALVEQGPVVLRRARHPLLVLSGRHCVPIDLEIAAGGTLIVSGPNAGGKTVALKTLGLSALMAAAGLHLPLGPDSTLPLVDELLCDIGDEQSLERNLSTFSAHVLRLCDFLSRARPGALVLLDEIAVGTDPGQGAAIAQAVLEALAAAGAIVMVTTHYDRLKALAATAPEGTQEEPAQPPRFTNASVGFDLIRLEPTFQLHLGIPGSSGALVVARRLGLPGSVAARAESLLGAEEASIEHILISLSDERRRLEEERTRLEEGRRLAERETAQAEAQARELRERTRQLHLRSYDEAVEALRAVRAELDRMKSGIKRARDPEAAVSQAAETIARNAPVRELPGSALAADQIEPGMHVAIVSWGGEGTVLAPPARGHVLVQAGALRTMVKVEDLRRLDRKSRPPKTERPPSRPPRSRDPRAEPGPATPSLRTVDNTLDLRGERVDDALGRLDRFLDDSLRHSREVVFVLHGHGTGALRTAVREYLADHAAVTGFRAAESEQGGDAVTLVELR
jgi:DNA mismatch repair protein MutS2